MNDTEINALLGVLETQRNNALNGQAKAEANNITLRGRISELEAKLVVKAEEKAS